MQSTYVLGLKLSEIAYLNPKLKMCFKLLKYLIFLFNFFYGNYSYKKVSSI